MLHEIVDLASGGGERVFDRHLNMIVPFVVGRRAIDYDVFVRWNCKPDMDVEVAAVTVFVAGCYHCYAASNDMAIVLFQLLYFTFDRSARSLRRIGSFKGHLQRNLHDNLSVAVDPWVGAQGTFYFTAGGNDGLPSKVENQLLLKQCWTGRKGCNRSRLASDDHFHDLARSDQGPRRRYALRPDAPISAEDHYFTPHRYRFMC